ncbi:sensor histidine kinase [Streptomyces sp. NPDC060184]|uniref:sensor histidine kinase n=1 Tax=Streptomyces sp. NPDC060184 TaxID=3347064 RepID=UPI00366A15F6
MDLTCEQERQEFIDTAVAEYREELQFGDSPLLLRPDIWPECERQARDIMGELTDFLADGVDSFAAEGEFTSIVVGYRRAMQRVPTAESVRAAHRLFSVALGAIDRALSTRPPQEGRALLMPAVNLLYTIISRRIDAALIGYEAATLHTVGEANGQRRIELAHEVHDHLGGSLALALRRLDVFEAETGAHQRLGEVRQALADSFRFTRTLVSGLRVISEEGLLKSIRGYARSEAPPGTEITVDLNGDEEWLQEQQRQQIFLVLRECLRNAFSHARATTVIVELNVSPREFEGIVSDNGCGFDAQDHPWGSGAGLRTMRERVDALGGLLQVRSRPGNGTTIDLRIPLEAMTELQSVDT